MGTKVERVTLYTYSDAKGARDGDCVAFHVPKDWLLQLPIMKEMSLEEFLITYTWDETLEIKRKAYQDGVLRYGEWKDVVEISG